MTDTTQHVSSPPKKPDLPVLKLHSERYGPMGNVAAVGIQNQLGRPGLDRLTVLVREALQNSWDARIPDGQGMRMRLELDELDEQRINIIKQNILSHSPPEPALQMDELLSIYGTGEDQTPLRFMMFCDRRTTGLGGPTRADVVVEDPDQSRDFVDFLRNVGQPPERKLTGGTYGYGKASLYNTSDIHTIVVYTRCMVNSELHSRFITARLGEQFTVPATQEHTGIYTGRHWWGVKGDDEPFVEPLTGEEADAMAESLKMDRDFQPGECGTTIGIIAPTIDDRSAEDALRYMGEQIMWNFWPLIRNPDAHSSERMDLSLWLDGQLLEMPDIHGYEPIRLLIMALENLEAHQRGESLPHAGDVEEIRSKRPAALLGHLSLLRDLPKQPRWFARNGREMMPVETGNLHHVALMRAPRIVVKYVRGERLDSDMIHYGGVFVVHEDQDQVYADSEPPTHDNWVPEHLEEKNQQTLVRVGLRNIDRAIKNFIQPPQHRNREAEHFDLGAFSGIMGGLLVGQKGTGARVLPVKKRRSGKKASTGILIEDDTTTPTGKRAAHIFVEDVSLDVHEGRAVTVVTFRVRHASGESDTPVRADLSVILVDGKIEKKADNDVLEQPEVLFWLDVESGEKIAERTSQTQITAQTQHRVVVSMVADARIKVRLHVSRQEHSP